MTTPPPARRSGHRVPVVSAAPQTEERRPAGLLAEPAAAVLKRNLKRKREVAEEREVVTSDGTKFIVCLLGGNEDARLRQQGHQSGAAWPVCGSGPVGPLSPRRSVSVRLADLEEHVDVRFAFLRRVSEEPMN